MNKQIMKSGCIIFLLIVLYSCSSIEIRSPIVFKKSKPEEQPVSSEKTQAPSAPQQAKAGEQIPSPPSVIPERREMAKEAPVQAGTESAQTLPSQEAKTTTLSPAGIPVLSNQDLANYQFSILGHVEAKSPSKEGVTQEKALQNLKVEAFKRYGSLAQGIINIEYSRGITMLTSKQDRYESISADVVTLIKKAAVFKEAGTGTAPSDTPISGGVPIERKEEEIPQLSNIVILSSDDLFHLNFKILGTVTVVDESKKEFTEEQAIKNLKIEAFRLYGVQAMALTKIKLIKEAPVFYYKKTQSNKAPQTSKGFIKASAEAVTWPSDSRAARP
jgi:hypothetical protein